MGFYIDVDILDKKTRDKIGHIQNEKGGLGRAIYMFLPLDFKLDRETLAFTCETTVGAAINNLRKVKENIAVDIEKTKEKYDEWSKSVIEDTERAFSYYLRMLSIFDEDDIVFADMSEGMLALTKEHLDEFRPDIDYHGSMEFLNNVVKGDYIGYFCGDNLRQIGDNLIRDVEKLLFAEFPNLLKFRRDCNTCNVITMGDVKVLRMKATLIFKRYEDDKDNFYNPRKYLLPLFAFLQKRNISFVHTWDEAYCNEAEERGYWVDFYFNVSSAK